MSNIPIPKVGWTLDTLYLHFTKIITDQEKALQTALINSDKAISKAELSAEKRFDSVNEFRSLVNDLIKDLIPRTEVIILLKALADRISTLETHKSELIGEHRKGTIMNQTIMAIIALVLTVTSIIVSISISILLRH